jgi:hypothetical protein
MGNLPPRRYLWEVMSEVPGNLVFPDDEVGHADRALFEQEWAQQCCLMKDSDADRQSEALLKADNDKYHANANKFSAKTPFGTYLGWRVFDECPEPRQNLLVAMRVALGAMDVVEERARLTPYFVMAQRAEWRFPADMCATPDWVNTASLESFLGAAAIQMMIDASADDATLPTRVLDPAGFLIDLVRTTYPKAVDVMSLCDALIEAAEKATYINGAKGSLVAKLFKATPERKVNTELLMRQAKMYEDAGMCCSDEEAAAANAAHVPAPIPTCSMLGEMGSQSMVSNATVPRAPANVDVEVKQDEEPTPKAKGKPKRKNKSKGKGKNKQMDSEVEESAPKRPRGDAVAAAKC